MKLKISIKLNSGEAFDFVGMAGEFVCVRDCVNIQVNQFNLSEIKELTIKPMGEGN